MNFFRSIYLVATVFCCSLIGFYACKNQDEKNVETTSKVVSATERKEADSLFELGRQFYFKRDFDTSVQTFLSVDSLYKKQANFERSLKARINIITGLQAMYVDNDSLLRFLVRDLPILKQLPDDSMEKIEYLMKLQEVNYALGMYEDAKSYALWSYELLQNIKNKDSETFKYNYTYTLRAITINEEELYNFQNAIAFAKKSVEFSEQQSYKIFGSNMELFTAYVLAKEYDNAKTQLVYIETNDMVDAKDIFGAFDFYRAKIKYYTEIKNYKFAFKAADDLQQIIEDSGYKKHFSEWFLTQIKSDLFLEIGNYQKVISFIEGLKIDPNYESASVGYRALDFLRVSEAHYNLQKVAPNHEKPWQDNLQKALNLHVPKHLQSNDFFKEVSFTNARYKDILISHLMFKAKSCFEYYQKTNNRNYLQIALHTFREAHKNLKSLGAMSDEDAFIKPDEFDQFYNDVLLSYHDVWTEKQTDELFYEVLRISDESKNIFILNELKRSATQRLFANIPKAIKNREAQLQKELSEATFADAALQNTAEIERIQQEINVFQQELKTDFPKYYTLKYNIETPIATVIENDLKKYNIISYTVTDAHIYIFNHNGEKKQFDKLNFDETLQSQLETYINSLQNFSDNSYKQVIKPIFNKLLKPYLDTEKPTLLVLDGVLTAIPFDVFRECISYQKPFIRLNNLRQTVESSVKTDSKTVVYAPFTKKNNAHVKWLPSSLEEAVSVQNTTDATLKKDTEARKETFLETAEAYDIIHLATHSKIDENTPLQSAIYFYGKPNELTSAYTLKTKSLYNLNFSADLVTLSSCESGTGMYVNGKGVQSISNAFSYAGAKSTVMSLWEVPDKTTAEIMDFFYQNLKNGDDKATALQRAKEQYLQQTSDENFKHPSFWASFVISGDISPVSLPNNSAKIWVVAVVGVILLLLLLFIIIRKKTIRNL